MQECQETRRTKPKESFYCSVLKNNMCKKFAAPYLISIAIRPSKWKCKRSKLKETSRHELLNDLNKSYHKLRNQNCEHKLKEFMEDKRS